MKFLVLVLAYFLFSNSIRAQIQHELKGRVFDKMSLEALGNVFIKMSPKLGQGYSDKAGFFSLLTFSNQELVLEFRLEGYQTLKMPIKFSGSTETISIGEVGLTPAQIDKSEDKWVELSPQDFEEENEDSNYITGVLAASKNLFARTAAFDFGMTFFKPRNLGSAFNLIMLNGVKMNKIFNNRPEWSNWGGLNDALRNQEVYPSLMSSPYDLGGLSSTININSSALAQRKGIKISYAASNKSYLNRLMATYSSGLLKKGWAYTFSGSVRYGDEGFRSGTMYKAYSAMASIDKKIGTKHAVNATLIYAYNERGKSAPMTQEVYDLKDIKYNSYWGFQEGNKRNSRLKRTVEPIFQFNHEFKINTTTLLRSHFTYQFGNVGSSRLDYGGGRWIEEAQSIVGGGNNPDPTYYQKLPSYFLRDAEHPDYAGAYLAEKEFLSKGQVDWTNLYEANQQHSITGNSVYVLYEDRHDDTYLSLDFWAHKKLSDHFAMDASFSMAMFRSENYAYMLDLLGGNGYLDVDTFADNWKEAQSNLLKINRVVREKEKFKYNYVLDAGQWKGFVSGNYISKKTEAFLAFKINSSNYQRNGNFENGAFPGKESLGKSRKLSFFAMSFKSGFTYKLTGRHLFSINANYLETPPPMRNVFSNARQNNDIVIGLKKENAIAFDGSYFFRHPSIRAKMTMYYVSLKDQSKISFYYADGLTGLENSDTNAYVQEILTGIDKNNMGIEVSIKVPLWINFTLKGVAAIGKSVYSSNPDLYLTSDDFEDPIQLGASYLKNYSVAGGPRRAFSLGFEYSSPSYWWFGISFNHFEQAYLDIAPINRTQNFYLDADGQPIIEYDPDVAVTLLKQESIAPYSIVNMVGGKSWKLKNKYVGFFASVNNITNTFYQTGGFEQARNANYNTLLEDKGRDKPLFGPKYWFGYGTTFFTSFYIRI